MGGSGGRIAWSGKSYGGYWGTLSFLALLKIGLLPAYFLLAFVAAFFVLFRRGAVAPIADYLARISGRRVRGVSLAAYESVFSFGMSILDRTAYFAGCGSIKVDDEGVEKIAEARAKGRGVLILASHTGGWAIASGELAAKFPDAAIVGADRERAEIRKLVNSSRARTAPETLSDFSDGFSPVAVYAALRAGRIAAMHADRDAGGRTAAARFLGAEVRSPSAPYACAWRAGAEVLQIFCFRESLFRYRIFCERIDLSECSSADKAAESGAAQFFSNLEGVLRRYPRQWYNFYDFFGKNP